MNHRHGLKRRHRNRVKKYLFIVIFLLIFIGLISYYLYNKLGPAWESEYLWKGISELNNEMVENLGELFAISQITFMEKDMQAYELLLQIEIKRIVQEYFGSQWNTFYIQSAMRLSDDISWEEFEDIIEPGSFADKMFASNLSIEEPDVSSNPPLQVQTEENIESSVVNPSEEDIEEIIEQLAYNVGGSNFPGLNGGLLGSIGFIASKSDDHTNGGRQSPRNDNNNPTPIPEPSTFILAGLGLLFLSQWFRRSRIPY